MRPVSNILKEYNPQSSGPALWRLQSKKNPQGAFPGGPVVKNTLVQSLVRELRAHKPQLESLCTSMKDPAWHNEDLKQPNNKILKKEEECTGIQRARCHPGILRNPSLPGELLTRELFLEGFKNPLTYQKFTAASLVVANQPLSCVQLLWPHGL